MIFRLLLISSDADLIATVHSLEHRRPVRSAKGMQVPDRNAEVTFVSSLESAVTSVQAAHESDRPFEIVVIDRACDGACGVSVADQLWDVEPTLSVIDCNSVDSESVESSTASHQARLVRLPREHAADQLKALVEILLDRAALRRRCQVMAEEVTRVNRETNRLEETVQSLNEQLTRMKLNQRDRHGHHVAGTSVRRLDLDPDRTERRSTGPAVRRMSVACDGVETGSSGHSCSSRKRQLEAASSPTDASDERRLSGRILVADDVPASRRLACYLLEHAGALVVQADSGRTAIDHYNASLEASEPFDAIVLHMAMEEMDGYECARQLRDNNFRGPIIAAITCSLPLNQHLCMNAGCDECVTMPLDRNQFVRTVRRMLMTPSMV
jgi:CheY-like chemotaxis protein